MKHLIQHGFGGEGSKHAFAHYIDLIAYKQNLILDMVCKLKCVSNN